MNKRSLKVWIFAACLIAGAISMSSCNKGYGCPNEFSVGMILPTLVMK